MQGIKYTSLHLSNTVRKLVLLDLWTLGFCTTSRVSCVLRLLVVHFVEMIHAFLFVTENNRDRSGHGPNFCAHMRRINNAGALFVETFCAKMTLCLFL